MTLSTADISPFTTEERVVSVWVREKGRSGQMFDEIRAKSASRFNKVALTKANLRK
jgi:hypothetical protein